MILSPVHMVNVSFVMVLCKQDVSFTNVNACNVNYLYYTLTHFKSCGSAQKL